MHWMLQANLWYTDTLSARNNFVQSLPVAAAACAARNRRDVERLVPRRSSPWFACFLQANKYSVKLLTLRQYALVVPMPVFPLRVRGAEGAHIVGRYSTIRLAHQSAVTESTVKKEALEKTVFRMEGKRNTMGRARVSLKAGAVLLERRRMAYAEVVFDRDAAMGAAELGYTNNEAALVVVESNFIQERENCTHLARGLDTPRAARGALRCRLVQEDKRGGGAEAPSPSRRRRQLRTSPRKVPAAWCLPGLPIRPWRLPCFRPLLLPRARSLPCPRLRSCSFSAPRGPGPASGPCRCCNVTLGGNGGAYRMYDSDRLTIFLQMRVAQSIVQLSSEGTLSGGHCRM